MSVQPGIPIEYQNQLPPAPTNVMIDHDYRSQMLKHSRRIDASTRFIAWVVGIFAVLSLIGILFTAVQIAKVGNAIAPSDISICQSLGGTDPSC